MRYGEYHMGNVMISQVYYVEGLGHNLFSIGQFCDSDLKVAFRKHTCYIRDLEGVALLMIKGFKLLHYVPVRYDAIIYHLSLVESLKDQVLVMASKVVTFKLRFYHCTSQTRTDASAKLTRAKLNKRSGDADLSKDKSGPESPPELRRSCPYEGPLSLDRHATDSLYQERALRLWDGDKGRRNGNPWGPTEPVSQTQKTPSPSPAFIKENIDVLRTMIKEHDQQAKMKTTPRKLAYADSDKEAPASKSQKTPSKNKEPTHLRSSRRLEDQSTTKEKARRERFKSRGKRSKHQEISSDSEHEEGLKDAYEDLNSPYKRPKPTPFTQRITRFKYHRRENSPGTSEYMKETRIQRIT
ncbi:hypothetical protein Tco_0172427 [Tanacetum coccineum]